ncbi:hypothetical protein M2254_002086 [Chryseobacterium sp. BIGb0186]|nr:hypothetical protein [Chryseobacterium sp. JUb44]MDH6210502.1 hypothetical protein [Chryseobacterium sp. BIGb0186]
MELTRIIESNSDQYTYTFNLTAKAIICCLFECINITVNIIDINIDSNAYILVRCGMIKFASFKAMKCQKS